MLGFRITEFRDSGGDSSGQALEREDSFLMRRCPLSLCITSGPDLWHGKYQTTSADAGGGELNLCVWNARRLNYPRTSGSFCIALSLSPLAQALKKDMFKQCFKKSKTKKRP